MNPDEEQALGAKNDRGRRGEVLVGPESAGEDERDAADKFEDAKGGPGGTWERAEGWDVFDVFTDFVEEKNFHHARGCLEKRGHDLENPQEDVHGEESLSGPVMGCLPLGRR